MSGLFGDAAQAQRIPISQLALRLPQLRELEDPAQIASAQRVRSIVGEIELREELLPMCTMVRAAGGGSIRTFNGGLAHENGWYCSRKGRRLLHFEGETALLMLIASEVDRNVERIGSESVGFEIPIDGQIAKYTVDVELVAPDGAITLVEVKRTERDLADPAYRLKLAYVHEICRRCGIRFRIIFRDEIYRNVQHRRNAGLFASRAFVAIGERHLRRLAEHRRMEGGDTTYGALAAALEPDHPVAGKGIVQGLLVRRRLTMDLTERLHDGSPVEMI